MVAPVCQCPHCGEWGLHYMAETIPEWHESPKSVAVIEEFVPGVEWYDQREKPVHQLKHHIERKMVITTREYIKRECFYCHKVWREFWREQYEV